MARQLPFVLALCALLTLGVACSDEAHASNVTPPSEPAPPARIEAFPDTRTEGDPAPLASAEAMPAGEAVETPVQVRPRRVVVIDPGHAADEVGAAAYGVVEKHSNLDMARRVADRLLAEGVEVILTRHTDARPASPDDPERRYPLGYNGTRLDLQARIDIANVAGADAFVSIHSNGAGDPSIRGVEAYYNSSRPFADRSQLLATLMVDGTLEELSAIGMPSRRRGVLDDACLKAFQGRCFPLFVLGPPRVTDRDEVYRRGGSPEALGFAPGQRTIESRATQMPGALIELLFISSPADAAMLRNDGARDAMARGVARGILQYLDQAAGGG